MRLHFPTRHWVAPFYSVQLSSESEISSSKITFPYLFVENKFLYKSMINLANPVVEDLRLDPGLTLIIVS